MAGHHCGRHLHSGGRRITTTLGRRIVHLGPPRGFAAETAAAAVLYTTAFLLKAPFPTTQTITAAILGAGATRRASAVRWQVVRSILTAWILAFPGAGLPSAAAYLILQRRHRPVTRAGGRPCPRHPEPDCRTVFRRPPVSPVCTPTAASA
ncbi:inorganic phosphate transporter [Streptomyces sp. TG1A-8]|nr:inorganic phosphate transporter [Streptomyces sp. TG1A-8]MDO0929497.1 inorganic phosphate transporter [Streptomyces sp. TG1A-8]